MEAPVTRRIWPTVDESVRAVKAPVPLPCRSPVRVEAPVPPLETERRVWSVREPRLAAAEKRLVEEAVVEKKSVVVAEVVVAFTPVKFCKVEDAVVRKPPSELILKSSVPAEFKKERNLPVKLTVEEALIKVPVVPVAFTWKSAERSRDAVVVAPTTNDLYGAEVAERKSSATESSRVLPKEAPPEASPPSQRSAEPVIWIQVAVAAAVQPEPVDMRT